MSKFNKSKFKKLYLPGLLSTCLAATTAYAGVSAEEAATLGGDKLTPAGAERAANADGSIPEWTGGMTKPPAGYKEGQRMIDPFADEKPLFTITAQNSRSIRTFSRSARLPPSSAIPTPSIPGLPQPPHCRLSRQPV